jgi:hypothetical protein
LQFGSARRVVSRARARRRAVGSCARLSSIRAGRES